jgi:POT family proton-dependent oligopeptide transporter
MTAHDKPYLTTPDQTETRMPGGVPFIIGNELAERFSFYGMKGILTVFMTQHLMTASGESANMSDERAKTVYHLFTASAYFFPILGAIMADVFWGKYKTILWISLMYCVGHACLALMDIGPVTGLWDMKPFLFLGLALIAVGAGGIKPCVSAHVGDQFGRGNKHLLTQIFNWFYFSINVGAMLSTILTPILLEKVGPWAAFGLPGALMAVATFLFWMGRHKFIHVPAAGWENFKRETFGPEGRRAILNLAPLFLIFVPVFWAIFDQTGSAWVLQAESMDRRFLGFTWLESQVQAVNPFFILLLIPVFTYGVYPAISKVFPLTPLRKIGIGFVLTAATFALSAMIEVWIGDRSGAAMTRLWADMNAPGDMPARLSEMVRTAKEMGWTQEQLTPYLADMPNIGLQFIAYIILTSAEIMVSIVCLEFAYTQSPKRMKSFVMGIYFLGVSLGNFYVSGVNIVMDAMKDPVTGATPLDGANYYWFFAGLMMAAFFVYLIWAKTYKGQTYIQGEPDTADIRCPSCGYDLHGSSGNACPECGADVTDLRIMQAQAEAQGPDSR